MSHAEPFARVSFETNRFFHERAVLLEDLDAVVLAVADVDHAVARDRHAAHGPKLFGRRRGWDRTARDSCRPAPRRTRPSAACTRPSSASSTTTRRLPWPSATYSSLAAASNSMFAGRLNDVVLALPSLAPGLPNCCRNFPSRENFRMCASMVGGRRALAGGAAAAAAPAPAAPPPAARAPAARRRGPRLRPSGRRDPDVAFRHRPRCRRESWASCIPVPVRPSGSPGCRPRRTRGPAAPAGSITRPSADSCPCPFSVRAVTDAAPRCTIQTWSCAVHRHAGHRPQNPLIRQGFRPERIDLELRSAGLVAAAGLAVWPQPACPPTADRRPIRTNPESGPAGPPSSRQRFCA